MVWREMPIIMWLCLPAAQFRMKWFLSYIWSIVRSEKQLSVDWNIIFLNGRTIGFQSEAIGVQLVILQVEHCSDCSISCPIDMRSRSDRFTAVSTGSYDPLLNLSVWDMETDGSCIYGSSSQTTCRFTALKCTAWGHICHSWNISTIKLVNNAADSDSGWITGLWENKISTIHCI